MEPDGDDLMEFVGGDGDDAATEPAAELDPWNVLVVDDDPDVHETTAFGLRGVRIKGRPLKLLHAHSGAQALTLLAPGNDVAVILLDVVMETDNAGLETVDAIRRRPDLANVRIVLRTGQPGQAPEMETIQRYDINDYKTKSELTRTKLFATLTTAIRSFDQLRRLDASRRGLEQIVAASNQFIAERGLQAFAQGVIMQIAGLIGIEPEGLVCASSPSLHGADPTRGCTVIAAAGRLAHLINQDVDRIGIPAIEQALSSCLAQRRHILDRHAITLFFPGRESTDFAAYIQAAEPLREVDTHLLEVFCTNIALCADNIELVKRLREFAFQDRLLHIPNRTAFLQRLDQHVEQGRPPGYAVALVDIAGFAETNEMFGHAYGDALLAAVSQRLVAVDPQRCTVARVEGDTFAMLGPESLVNVAAVGRLFAEPFEVDSVLLPVSVSMGLVRCDESSGLGPDMLKEASIALKRAKELGPGRNQYYSQEMGLYTRERTRLLHGLHEAFERDELQLVYQPQVSLHSGLTTGVEALLRWRRADGSFVSPGEFIPVAEQSGLIVRIGAWVLTTALRALMTLRAAGFTSVQMAVNVSSVQFSDSRFVEMLDEALRATQAPADRLELEVTESVAVMGMETLIIMLGQLKSRGIQIAIDDFGTGFSSLSYLNHLPANRLKIDRAFVSQISQGDSGGRIAEMIVPLGHRLGMTVVAEGVETDGQMDHLRAMGCDEVQGYHLARPMPLDALITWMHARAAIETNPALP